MDIKKIEDFISSKYENKDTQYKAKSYIKKGVAILETSNIATPSEKDFGSIDDKATRSYTRSFYSWLNGEPETLEKEKNDFTIKKRNINFLIDDEKYKILSVFTLQNDTTISAILNDLIDDFLSSHAEKVNRIKNFLNEE